MVKPKPSNIVREFYTDFYGCRYRITRDLRTGLCLLTGYMPNGGGAFVNSKYNSYRGVRIALGKYSEGAARKEDR